MFNTEERRKELVKQTKNAAEQTRVSVRNIRRDLNNNIKQLAKEGLAEDEAKDAESEAQQLTDKYITEIDKRITAKESEIMTV